MDVKRILGGIIKWFQPPRGKQQWRTWIAHSLVALLIGFILKLVFGVPDPFAAVIPISMYSGRELLAWAEELIMRVPDIDSLDHFMDFFIPLIVVLSVFSPLGWL